MLFEWNRVCGRMSRGLVGVVFMASLMLSGGPVFGQDDKSVQDPLPVHVVRLQHINAKSAAQTLQQVYEHKLRVVAEPSANSLVIAAEKEQLKSVLVLLESLDVEQAAVRRPEVVTHAIELKQRHSQDLALLLNLVIEGTHKRGQVALDEQRNLLIVQGEAEIIETVDLLVEQLDRPIDTVLSRQSAGVDHYRVRVVWLVSESGDVSLGAVPPDMKEVVAELEKIGVSDLGLAAQLIVAATPGEDFMTMGATDLDTTYTVDVGGKITVVDQDDVRLELGVQGSGVRKVVGRSHPTDPPASTHVTTPLNLHTTITAAAGQSVVLGVTPLGERTSVLVVQVSPVD